MVDILYSDIRRGGYRDSASVSVSSPKLNLGRLTFGLTIGATFKDENAGINPFFRLNGRWDFISHKDFSFSGSIGLPLSVFSDTDNALSAGLLSMDFAGNASTASTKLRLSIPLHK